MLEIQEKWKLWFYFLGYEYKSENTGDTNLDEINRNHNNWYKSMIPNSNEYKILNEKYPFIYKSYYIELNSNLKLANKIRNFFLIRLLSLKKDDIVRYVDLSFDEFTQFNVSNNLIDNERYITRQEIINDKDIAILRSSKFEPVNKKMHEYVRDLIIKMGANNKPVIILTETKLHYLNELKEFQHQYSVKNIESEKKEIKIDNPENYQVEEQPITYKVQNYKKDNYNKNNDILSKLNSKATKTTKKKSSKENIRTHLKSSEI